MSWVILLAAGCGGVSCGSLDAAFEPTDAEVGGPPPDDALEQLRRARCELAVACDCVSNTECDAAFADPIASMFLELEGANFNTSCFDEVIRAMEQNSCGDPPLTPGCDLFDGEVQSGGRCLGYLGFAYWATNCAPGLRCRGDAGEDFSLCGPDRSAANDGLLGENCDPDAVVEMCTSGLYCQQGDNVCVVEVDDGDPCFQETACSVISYCKGGASGEGTCALRLNLGEACNAADDRYVCAVVCDDEGICRGAECVDGVCVSPEPVAPACAEVVALPGL